MDEILFQELMIKIQVEHATLIKESHINGIFECYLKFQDKLKEREKYGMSGISRDDVMEILEWARNKDDRRPIQP